MVIHALPLQAASLLVTATDRIFHLTSCTSNSSKSFRPAFAQHRACSHANSNMRTRLHDARPKRARCCPFSPALAQHRACSNTNPNMRTRHIVLVTYFDLIMVFSFNMITSSNVSLTTVLHFIECDLSFIKVVLLFFVLLHFSKITFLFVLHVFSSLIKLRLIACGVSSCCVDSRCQCAWFSLQCSKELGSLCKSCSTA